MKVFCFRKDEGAFGAVTSTCRYQLNGKRKALSHFAKA